MKGIGGVVLLLALGSGCGLIDPDVTTIRFELMPIKYGVDTRMFSVPPAFWRLRCGSDSNVCCQAIDCTAIPLVCAASPIFVSSPTRR
jgi:hypothetical protein